MIRADSAIVIERPPAAVFEYVAHGFFANYPRWAPEVVHLAALTPGPIRVGVLGRQTRVDYGRRTEATFRVTRLEPPRLVAFEGISTPFTIAYGFSPAGEHTRVTLIFELLRLEFFMRPFERIIRGAVRDSVAGTMKRLKTTVEREIALPGAAPAATAADAVGGPAIVAAVPTAAPAPAGDAMPAASVAPSPIETAPSPQAGVHAPMTPPPIPPAADPDPGLSRA